MVIKKSLFLSVFIFSLFQSYGEMPLVEQLQQTGYVEMCNTHHGAASFDALYASFDDFISFFQANPAWAQKLYSAKERFIRTKNRKLYSTDFFGLYDESYKKAPGQVSFYYAPHFHEFFCSNYPECKLIPEIMRFLEACLQMQKSYVYLCNEVVAQLAIEPVFEFTDGEPPLLLKVVKYLPCYSATKPHYDGTAFSLFLDSTDNQSLLLASYKSAFTRDNFDSPLRKFAREEHQNSMLLIPGAFLTEFSIYPTPHIVIPTGNTRYATILFAMRPNYTTQKKELSPLPIFKH